MIKVFGHYSPDTDATISAIVWAWYLQNHTDYDATAYVLGNLNPETTFVLTRYDCATPETLTAVAATDDVAIVDTNNPQELPSNINEAHIITLIDHHKLVGGLTTDNPTTITMRPVAATATIIHDLITAADVSLPEQMKGLLLSAILSDTLAFRSPTTTPHDQTIAESLAKDLGVDPDTYAKEMFAAKSDISDISNEELLLLDSKKFAVGDKNIRVSVVETTNPATVLARQSELVTAIATQLAKESDVDDILFCIVDILEEATTVLTYNDFTKQLVASSFNVPSAAETASLPGVVSRKKQILPALKL